MKAELLSPAGSLKAMRMAFAYGADAVYAGQPRYSLRVRNNEFTLETLATGIREAHAAGKKFYVVSNIAPHNRKMDSFIDDIGPVVDLNPDALIVSDPGVIYLLQKHYPQVSLHLSVQANTVNWAAVEFWYSQGVDRVILSRELGLDEIAEIRQRVPQMEIEVFVHGALCMAYSGRCLLSGYFNKRDPNQGACTNSCRWPYKVSAATEDAVGQINPIESETAPPVVNPPVLEPVVLEEPQRPGEYMPLEEDMHGSYIMNSKDLRAVQHVEALTKMGVHSLKIEGRTKSPYYVARTAQVYRRAIDDAAAGKPFDERLLAELDGMANRGFTEGFLQRHRPQDTQNYVTSHSAGTQQLVGEFTGETQGDLARVMVKNRFSRYDHVEVMTPSGNYRWQLESLYADNLQPTDVAKGSGHWVWVNVPQILPLDHAMLLRHQVADISLAKEVS